MIKKLLLVLLTYLLMFSGIVVDTAAVESNYDDFEYIRFWNKDEYNVTAYKGTDPNVIIPDTINGKPVTNMTYFTCTELEEIESLTIPKTIEVINGIDIAVKTIIVDSENSNFIVDNNVLYSSDYSKVIKCPSMIESFDFDEKIDNIASYCFSGTKIKSAIVPETVEHFSQDAFRNAAQLENLELNLGYDYLMAIDLSGNTQMKRLFLGKNIQSIWWIKGKIESIEVSKDNSNLLVDNNILYSKDYQELIKCSTLLDSIVINEDVKKFSEYCFEGSKITSLIIPSTVNNIYNNNIFYGMDYLKELEIRAIYAGNDKNIINSLEKLTISDNQTANNFNSLSNLKELNLLEGITEITWGFYDCDSLESIILPASLNNLSGTAFANCDNLKEMNVNKDNSVYQSVDGVVYQGDELVVYPSGKKEATFEVDNVSGIKDYAFYTNNYVNEVIVSNNVKEIGEYAFKECEGLKKVVLPPDLEIIGRGAFHNCTNLKEINIPKNINTLYESKYDSNLKAYQEDMPSGYYDSIGYVFKGCSNLETIIIDEENKNFIIDDNCLYNSDYSVLLKNMNKDITSFIANENTKCIEIDGLSNKSNLKNIDLKNVTDIMYNSFANCSALENVEYPNVINFGLGGNFYQCTALEKITLPEKMDDSNYFFSIFNGCDSLIDVNLNNLRKFNSQGIYSNCIKLKEIAIPRETEIVNINNYSDITYYVYPDSYALKYIQDLNNIDIQIKYKIINEINESATNIKVDTGTSNNIDQDAKLVVNKITDGDVYNKVIKALKNFNIYDISFKKGEQTIDVDGYCIVSVPVQDDMDKDKCKIYYLDDNGNYEDMKAKYQEGVMVFRTNHFSNYILTDSELSKHILGDVNNDGIINYSDAVLVLQNDTGSSNLTSEQLKAANVNGDNVIDYNDAVQILKYDAGNITEFK